MNKRNKILAISSIVVVVIVVSSTGWYFFLNLTKTEPIPEETINCNFEPGEPITIHQLANCDFEDGDVVNLTGTIAEVGTLDTNYGSFFALKLENDNYSGTGGAFFHLLADTNKKYNVGDEIQMTLHLEEIQINDNKLFTAEEFGIHLILSTAIMNAIDATSSIAGIGLVQKSIDGEGNTQYEVFTRNGEAYPLDLLNVTLTKGKKYDADFLHVNESMLFGEGSEKNYEFAKDFAGILTFFASQYVGWSGLLGGGFIDDTYHEKIDLMESLENGLSENGSIEFIDMNFNGLIDDHDIFNVYIPPTPDQYTYEIYGLVTGGSGIASGLKLIVNWYNGSHLVHWYNTSSRETRSGVILPALSYVSAEENNSLIDTTIKVSRIDTDEVLPNNQYDFSLRIKGEDFDRYQVSNGIINIKDNLSVEFIDSNDNTLLDVDDIFVIRGLGNQTYVEFLLFDKEKNWQVIDFHWVVDYGYVIGNLPNIVIENKGLIPESENQYRVNVSVSSWHPEFDLNLTLRLSVSKDSVLLQDSVPLKDGIIGSYNGRNISFVDADDDSYLSTGDYLLLECEPGSTYSLEVSILFDNYKYSAEIVS